MKNSAPPLKDGEQLDQRTFHARYEASPRDFRAELIAGIVHVPPRVNRQHGQLRAHVVYWLVNYAMETPGTEGLTRTTNILAPDSEPAPHACLLILPEYGGQTREDENGYLAGPPELVAQISDSSERLDLNERKRDFEKAGVREYLVVAVRRKKVHWFIRRRGKFLDLPLDADGIFRSETFPGLWLDPVALLGRDDKRMLAVLRLGLALPEHGEFVGRLARKGD